MKIFYHRFNYTLLFPLYKLLFYNTLDSGIEFQLYFIGISYHNNKLITSSITILFEYVKQNMPRGIKHSASLNNIVAYYIMKRETLRHAITLTDSEEQH